MKRKLTKKKPVKVNWDPHPEALALVEEMKKKPPEWILRALGKIQCRRTPVPTLKHEEFNLLPHGAFRVILGKPSKALLKFLKETRRESEDYENSQPTSDGPCIGGVYENPFLRKH